MIQHINTDLACYRRTLDHDTAGVIFLVEANG
jgi:hypothetical protein